MTLIALREAWSQASQQERDAFIMEVLPSRGRSGRDLAGQRFGKLVAIERHHKDRWGAWHWLVKCDCGREHTVVAKSLTNGDTRSCGCVPRPGGPGWPKGKPRRSRLAAVNVWALEDDREP